MGFAVNILLQCCYVLSIAPEREAAAPQQGRVILYTPT